MSRSKQHTQQSCRTPPIGQLDSSPDRGAVAQKRAFCVFIDTLIDGTVVSDRDLDGRPFVYNTRVEAERAIADLMMTRLQEFMDGEREFDDATTVEDYVMEVSVLTDGSVVNSEGKHFK